MVTTGRERSRAQLDLHVGSVIPQLGFWRLGVANLFDYKQDRSRVVTNALAGTVNSEESLRRLGPRWTLTLGTRL